MTSISKQGIILNPSKRRIIAKNETFDDCLKRVKDYNTRDIVTQHGDILHKMNKSNIKILQEKDASIQNNSSISATEIWNRPEVVDELSKFPKYYEYYEDCVNNSLYDFYGLKAKRLCENRKTMKDFELCYKCFRTYNYDLFLLQLTIEFLNNLLCRCGYNKDKTEIKTSSGIHDVSHMIYAKYCHYFISNDVRLLKRAEAIYEYLGLKTKMMTVNNLSEKVYELENI